MEAEVAFDISLTDVTKMFPLGPWKQKTAVDSVTLMVPRGEIVGLLGPNGSGKSTIIKMILGFLRPTRGEVLVCNLAPSDRKSRLLVGYLPENPRFPRFLTGHDALSFYGRLLSLSGAELGRRVDEVLALVGLRAGREKTQGYSKGMTQRLALAQAILGRPRVLILDEPMSGLDPIGRIEIRALIGRIHAEMPGMTIFFSTHILTDVEKLCSSVLVLREGKIQSQSSLEDLLRVDSEHFDIFCRDLAGEAERVARKWGAVERSPGGETVTVAGLDKLISSLTDLRAAGARVMGVFSRRKSLEDALFRESQSVELTTGSGEKQSDDKNQRQERRA